MERERSKYAVLAEAHQFEPIIAVETMRVYGGSTVVVLRVIGLAWLKRQGNHGG